MLEEKKDASNWNSSVQRLAFFVFSVVSVAVIDISL